MRELEVAIQAARTAGEAVRRIYESQDFTVTQKGDKGPLTEADLTADRILHEVIRAAFPSDPILSEETADDPVRLQSSRVWIIDPVDGTREFTMGIPEFCVSVGFVRDGRAVAGALFNPATGQLISGAEGLGATLDGEAREVTTRAQVEGSRFLVSRSEHGKGWFDDYLDVADMTPMGSVAWKVGLVAVGLADATFTPKPRNEWDLCGGVACLLASGGRATNGQGQPYVFNEADPLKIGVFCTNGPLHEATLAMAKR